MLCTTHDSQRGNCVLYCCRLQMARRMSKDIKTGREVTWQDLLSALAQGFSQKLEMSLDTAQKGWSS